MSKFLYAPYYCTQRVESGDRRQGTKEQYMGVEPQHSFDGVSRGPLGPLINYKTLKFKGICVPISSDTCYMASEYTT